MPTVAAAEHARAALAVALRAAFDKTDPAALAPERGAVEQPCAASAAPVASGASSTGGAGERLGQARVPLLPRPERVSAQPNVADLASRNVM